MSNIFRYDTQHEDELIALLSAEPDWNTFTRDQSVEGFRKALLVSDTYICKSNGEVCGYLRAMVDGFGIYVSELYVAPQYRNHGHGKALLGALKHAHPNQDVYVLSDEDSYYEKLGYRRVGSVFQLC
jgi:ribosomal protein S18 acetylase RimI-like enzyme